MKQRCMLFVPGNRPERFDKAVASGADAVILDLEDAVAPENKGVARQAMVHWFAKGHQAWIRINGDETPWHNEDLALLAQPGVLGVMVPKAETAKSLERIRQAMRPGVGLIPIIETGLGLWRVGDLAAVGGVMRLAFGSVDFQLDLSISGDDRELLFARSQIVLASRVAGLLAPLDGVTVAIDDEAQLRRDVESARRFGFGGKLCIHPRQVAITQAGFAPPDAELQWARSVLAAVEAAGSDAVRVDGKLVDLPLIHRARALLDQGT